MPPYNLKCLQCKTKQSRKNRTLYNLVANMMFVRAISVPLRHVCVMYQRIQHSTICIEIHHSPLQLKMFAV